jgi:hypothetical protein
MDTLESSSIPRQPSPFAIAEDVRSGNRLACTFAFTGDEGSIGSLGRTAAVPAAIPLPAIERNGATCC